MYKKVLVPLDGSELAECSLNHVKGLMNDGSGGEVTLFNVVKVDVPWVIRNDEEGTSQVLAVDINTVREKAFQASRKYLEKVSSRLASEGIKVKTESLEANRPAEAITDYARKKGMDVIVIATHGFTGFKKMMLGSVALGVLHQSHVPVLLIRHESCQTKES
jgi:nucleotide-binding universal stress UspA family protein